MPLKLPPFFENDIQGRDTALVPIVKIGSIYISTNSMTYDSQHVLPILTSNPSLKESIDIETRRYKISNISSITINNYPYEGQRFSERVEGSLINDPVEVYWISPSTTTLEGEDDGAFKIYQGQVRKYDHDDSVCKISVEDRSQATLHKDLPTANLGTGAEVPDKYKNKPIPMVYGHVDKSLCVIGEQLESGEVKIFTDDPSSSSTISTNSNPLSIFRDNKYLDVLSDYDDISHWGYSDGLQYTAINNIFLIATPYIQDVDNLDVKNPLGENMCAVKLIDTNYTYKLYTHLDNYSPTDSDREYAFNAFSVNDLPEIYRTNVGGGDVTTFYEYRIQLIFERLNKVDENYHQDSTEAHITYLINYDWNANALNYEDAKYIDVRLQPEVDGTDIIIADTEGLASTTSDGVSQLPALNISYNHNIGWVNESVAEQALYSQTMRVFPSLTASSAYSNIIINEFTRIAYFLIDKFRLQDFYANVNGRAMNGELSPTAPSAIAHILENELDSDVNIDTDDLPSEYSDWKYAFTVDKKINSKKLIENIASASPFIPRFNNMGEFRFDTIPVDGGTADFQIKEVDVIDFSFSRSKIESVFSKIILKYNWDYARGEYNSTIGDKEEITIDVAIPPTDTSSGYEAVGFDYYGLNPDHSESTLIIDDKGKYIRDYDTAENFAFWNLMWSCNQKLKLKIKLGLKYMNLEIGDIVNFDELLGGVKPYGIDYTIEVGNLNHQNIYPNFLIINTNKTLEFCEIECIQLHHLIPTCEKGCDNVCDSGLVVDECGVCGGEGSTQDCDCQDIPEGDCDCNGNVADCSGACGGNVVVDECGTCGGDNTSCIPEIEVSVNGATSTIYINDDGHNEVAFNIDAGSQVTLDSSLSSILNIDYTIFKSSWHFYSGASVEFSCAECDVTTITAPTVNGDVVLGVTVEAKNNDETHYTSSHLLIRLTVADNPPNAVLRACFDDSGSTICESGVIDAPSGQFIQLNGSQSTDDVGIASYTFTQMDIIDSTDPRYVELSCEECEDGIATFTTPPNNVVSEYLSVTTGNSMILMFKLEVKDGAGQTNSAHIIVDVYPTECDGTIGDVNDDGGINDIDITILANCVELDNCDSLSNIPHLCACDINGDGVIDYDDVLALAQYVLDLDD